MREKACICLLESVEQADQKRTDARRTVELPEVMSSTYWLGSHQGSSPFDALTSSVA